MKIDDKRGKHTKKDLEAKKQRLQKEFERLFSSRPSCEECSSFNTGETSEGDCLVCLDCGFVLSSHTNITKVPPSFVFPLSAKYLHRNYFSERIKQFQGTDPPFTNIQALQIVKVDSWINEKYHGQWPRSIYSFSKKHFGQICRILNHIQPKERWKQKIEKWLQGRDIIFGQDPMHTKDMATISHRLRELFDPVAFAFENKFKKDDVHNIPKLDLVSLILLYNISKSALGDYGWYFLNEDIYWETDAIIKDHEKILEILEWLNECFNNVPRTKNIRREAKTWLKKNKYKLPSLGTLKNIVLSNERSARLSGANIFFDFKINLIANN